MLCSLALESAIQHRRLRLVTLKFGLLCMLSDLTCMYVLTYNATSYLHVPELIWVGDIPDNEKIA